MNITPILDHFNTKAIALSQEISVIHDKIRKLGEDLCIKESQKNEVNITISYIKTLELPLSLPKRSIKESIKIENISVNKKLPYKGSSIREIISPLLAANKTPMSVKEIFDLIVENMQKNDSDFVVTPKITKNLFSALYGSLSVNKKIFKKDPATKKWSLINSVK